MNIIDVQDQLKDFSEQQLIKEMQMPSGNAPQFLVLTEIQRRKRMRDDFAKRQAAAEPTVAQEALSASGVPTEGIAGMSEAMAPQSAASDGIGTIMPQTMRQSVPPPAPMPDDMAMGMRSGGIVSLASGGRTRIEERRMPNGKIGLFRGNTFLGLKEENKSKGSLAEKIGFGKDRDVLGRIKDALGLQEGGVIKAQNGLPLGLRQRNPGNIRPGANFIGESGAGGGYATFGSDDEGLRAIQRLLMTYGDKYDIRTLRQLANRYAPPSDNNPTGNYIDFLSEKTGIDPDAEINLAESGSSIIPAIVGFEQGQQPYSQAQIDRAIRAAGTDDPAKVAEILGQPLLPEDIANQDLSQKPDMLSAFMSARADDGSSESEKPSEEEIRARVDAMKRAGGLGQYKGTVPNLGGSGVVIQDIDDAAKAAAINAETAQNQIVTSAEQGASALEVGDRIDDAQAASDKTAIIQAQSKDMQSAALEGESASNNEKAKKLLDEADKLESVAKNSPPAVKATLEKEVENKRTQAGELVTSAQDQSSQAVDAAAAAESQRSSLVPDKGTINTKESTDDKGSDGDKPKEKESNVSIDKTSDTSGALSLSDEIKALQAKMDKNRESDKWLALAQAGLALMSSDNPTLLGAAGEAGIEGLKAMREANERYEEGVVDLINARAKLASKTDKGALTASNAITRLGQLQKALSGADGAMMTEPEKAEARNEVLILKRFLQERGGLPVYAAMTPEVPAA